MEANPRGTTLGGQTFKEFAQSTAMVKVETIVSGILGNNYNLFDTGSNKGFGFADNVL